MALNWQTEYYRYRRYFVDIGHLYRQKKIRIYSGIVLSIIAVNFFLFFAIKPTLVTIAGLIKETKNRKIVAEKLKDKINTLSLAQKEYFSVEPNLPLIDQALPKESEISNLVKQLEAVSRQSGATLEALQFGEVGLRGTSSQEKITVVNFNLAATGDYQNLKKLLSSLTVLRRIITVEAFAFNIGKSEAKTLTLNLSAKAHFFKENQ